MVKLLVAGAMLWPALLTAAVAGEVRDHAARWPAVVYIAASHVCHQRPERSFHVGAVPWPVCARCLGLYLAAPIGALVVAAPRVRRGVTLRRLRWWLAVAAAPTMATLVLEHTGAVAVTNAMRFAAALPLGAALACALVVVGAGARESIE